MTEAALALLNSPVVAAGASGIAGLLANVWNANSVKKTNQQQKELAEYNWQQAIAQWNRENEYNKPVNQMARFAEAGLNPNLIYGQLSGNVAGSLGMPNMPNLQAPQLDANSVSGSFRGLIDALVTKQQLDNMKKSNEKLQEEINSLRIDNDQKAKMNPLILEKAKVDIDTAKQQCINLLKNNEAFDQRFNMEIQRFQRDILESQMRVAKTQEEINAIQANTYATYMGVRLTERQIDKLNEEIRGIKNENDYNAFVNHIMYDTGIDLKSADDKAKYVVGLTYTLMDNGSLSPEQAKRWCDSALAKIGYQDYDDWIQSNAYKTLVSPSGVSSGLHYYLGSESLLDFAKRLAR